MNKYLIGSHELCDSLFPGQYTANTFRFTILKKSSFFFCFFVSTNAEKNQKLYLI